MKTGQKTYKQIAAENGRDWRDQIDDMAEVLEYGREMGVNMENLIFGLGEPETGKEETDGKDKSDEDESDGTKQG